MLSLTLLKILKVPVEQVKAGFVVPDHIKLVEYVSGEGFFFYLLRNVPLHEIVRSIVFLIQAFPNDIVDVLGNLNFMVKDLLKDLSERREVHLGLFQLRDDAMPSSFVDEVDQLQHVLPFLIRMLEEEFSGPIVALGFRPGSHSEIELRGLCFDSDLGVEQFFDLLGQHVV